jgi:murein DD-endopeptidase MepM/ murein hydrolase activator NlpD
MKQLIIICFFSCLLSSCGVQHKISGSAAATDTSYVYHLPYKKGASYFLVQGYNSWFSHKGRLGLDFKMKKGTPVYAAREGVVAYVEENFTKGGISKKYLRRANSVVIRHSDGSYAIYGHLQHNGAAVKTGEIVNRGQLVGYSGSVGYSAFPHLHFAVWKPGTNGRRIGVPTRFNTKRGPMYLRTGRWYRSL